MRVEFYRHSVDETDIANVASAMRGLFLTTGQWVEKFEKDLASFTGRRRAVGVSSGTAALHLALVSLGIGVGDEVITTPMSFVATANAICMTGARPVFVDVESDSGNIDVRCVQSALTPRTRAILPVHLYGLMCDMRALAGIAAKHGLRIVEDAAHALEARRDGVRPGDLASAAMLSFYATKSITSGEGGAVITDDESLASRLKSIRLHGLSKSASERYAGRYEHYDMEDFGWKYNMSNIQAAMLEGQLPRVADMRDSRERICRAYEERFAGTAGIAMPRVPDGAVSGRHLFTVWVDPGRRDAILARLAAKGVGAAVNYMPIHLMKYYRDTFGLKEGQYPVAERIGASTISLPLYPKLTGDEVEYVAESVLEAVASADA